MDNRDKQIEEMADDVRRIRESYFGKADYLFAMKLYDDGYRKSSDVAEEIITLVKERSSRNAYSCMISGEYRETYTIKGIVLDEIEKEVAGE